MADITRKRNDTWPPIDRTLTETIDGVKAPINLTTATQVKLLMESTDGLTGISIVGTIAAATQGKVSFTPTGTTFSTVESYNCEVEITWAAGKTETVPNDGYFTLEVKADLG